MEEYQKKDGYGKKPLWFWIVVYVVLAIIIYGAVYYFFLQKSGSPYSASTTGQNNNTQGVLFAGTPDAQNAYLISTDTYDAKTQTALSGFKADRKVLADGTQQITLTAQNAGYQNQSYTVKPGQKLYFIERFLQDDVGGTDKNTGDDTAVLVDANGYIVK